MGHIWPNIALFKRVQNRWPIVDQSPPRPCTDPSVTGRRSHALSVGHLKKSALCGNIHAKTTKRNPLSVVLGGGVPTPSVPWGLSTGQMMTKPSTREDQLFQPAGDERREFGGICDLVLCDMVYAKYWKEGMFRPTHQERSGLHH
ncbi:hypothetical protein GWK47_021872 [Chionoecetes opilio]|uniref:Uncharacterized protein n=1 Tax=Chionoecetes opilio TaxID=41210 RepID=A0A8J4XSP4_CHIOP|nr:hypothetical protein GWK47_021872 [Chionoecetes opilio]